MAEMPWHCPNGTAHLFQITVDDHCVETIKRLTDNPDDNAAELRAAAAKYSMRDGSEMSVAASPGELLDVQCAKCGRRAIISVGWAR